MEKISLIIADCFINTLSAKIKELQILIKSNACYSFEIIFVCSQSSNEDSEELRSVCKSDDVVKGVLLAGKNDCQAAFMAGLRIAEGNYFICLRGDIKIGQSEFLQLLNGLTAGKEAVLVLRNSIKRIPPKFKNITIYTSCNSYCIALGLNIKKQILNYKGPYVYIPYLLIQLTDKIHYCILDIQKDEMFYTAYQKELMLAFGYFMATSIKSLRIVTICGGISSVIGLLLGIGVISLKISGYITKSGYSSIISAIVFFCGLIMLMLGILGEYIGRMYKCVNKTPQFAVNEIINL